MKINRYFPIFILTLFSFIALFNLFHQGLPITHDGQDHVARIANFYQNLSDGNIIPRWAGNLNWGYGHPVLMFLYPLPSYIASIFYFLGFSFIDSTKIVFGLAFVLSGITMYVWIQSFLGKNAGLVAGILYMFAPYRFVDLYVRGAIGEHVAFVFPPLVFYFMLKLSQLYRHSGKPSPHPLSLRERARVRVDSAKIGMTIKYWFILGGSLSIAGLLLSHNAISLMFLPIIFLYALYLPFTSEEPKSLFRQMPDGTWLRHLRGGVAAAAYFGGVLSKLKIILLGLGLSAFFWIPAFFEGKYTLRDIVTAGEYASRFTDFAHFVYSPWNYGGSGEFSLQIGIIHWTILVLTIPVIYILYKKKNNLWILGVSVFLIFWLTIFLMTPLSKLIWEYVTLLQKFQFPWRFMSVTVFSIAVLGGLVVYSLPNKFKSLIIFCFIVLILFFNKDFWHAKGYLYKDDSFFTGIYNGTTDTGESSPIWSVRFMEKRPKRHMEVISGEAVIKELSRKSTVHLYEIDATEKSRILENTLYFPGWDVLVDGKAIKPEFQDPRYRGLMTFFVEKGKHNVEIKFVETKLRLFADAISAATLVIIIFYPLLNFSLRSIIRVK